MVRSLPKFESDLSANESVESLSNSVQTHPDVPSVAEPQTVSIHYPIPTDLARVVEDVAAWSGKCFIIPPGVGGKVTIQAPRLLGPVEAFDIFLSALDVLNLRVIEDGAACKIVPIVHQWRV